MLDDYLRKCDSRFSGVGEYAKGGVILQELMQQRWLYLKESSKANEDLPSRKFCFLGALVNDTISIHADLVTIIPTTACGSALAVSSLRVPHLRSLSEVNSSAIPPSLLPVPHKNPSITASILSLLSSCTHAWASCTLVVSLKKRK